MKQTTAGKEAAVTKRIPAMTARKNFGQLLESVFYRGDEIIVERAGKAMGVLIPLAEYEKIERRRAEALASLEALWATAPAASGADEPEALEREALEREILEETQAVRHGDALALR